MNFSMTEQEKSDLLIEVTAWAGLTVLHYTRNLHIKVLRLSE
jgi:hypothetical protein